MSEIENNTTEMYFTTRVQPEIVKFKWEIPHFEEKWKFHFGTVSFQKINLVTKDNSSWSLTMRKHLNNSYLFFDCTNEANFSQLASIELRAANDSEVKYHEEERDPRWFPPETPVQVKSISCPPLVKGALIWIGKLTVYKKYEQCSSPPSGVQSDFKRTSMETFEKDMWQLLQNPAGDATFSDIEIHTDDGTVIPAHRYILASRCEYFKIMLTSGMAEVKTGKILVEGINGKAMKVLLHYLYTGCLHDNWSNNEILHDFTKAAHFYQVADLVKFLDENIAKVCDGRSAGNLLILCKTLEMKVAEKELRRLIFNRLNEFGGDPECDELLLEIGKKQNLIS